MRFFAAALLLMRILMTTSVYPRFPGDATPPFVQHLAGALAAQGWDVMVLAPHGPGARFCEEVTLDNAKAGGRLRIRRFPYAWPFGLQKLCYEGGMLVNLKTRPWTRLLLPFLIGMQLGATLWLILRYRPVLVHSHSLLPQGFTARWATTLLRRPHVTTSHGNDVFGLRPDGLMGKLKRDVLKKACAVTVNSRATRAAVVELGCSAEKIHLIPAMPGSSTRSPEVMDKIRAEVIGTRRPVLTFVGRLIEDKGVGDLLVAVAELRPTWPELVVLIVGDGQDRARFVQQAADLKLGEAVHWAGWVPSEHVVSWMAVADAVVVPSRENPGGWKEAQGLVVVEAMQAGRPVVATRTGGIPDMVVEAGTGFLVPERDPSALAAALDRLFRDPASAQAMGQAGQARAAEQFSPEAVTRQTEDLYRAMMKP